MATLLAAVWEASKPDDLDAALGPGKGMVAHPPSTISQPVVSGHNRFAGRSTAVCRLVDHMDR